MIHVPPKKRPGSLPLVVVDRLAFRLLVGGLALRGDVAVLLGFENQKSVVCFDSSFSPQSPCTPEFSMRSSTESWAAAPGAFDTHSSDLRRLATSANTSDGAVDVRVFLIKDLLRC